MFAEYDAAHQAMARETWERLAADRATLKADTAALMAEYATEMKGAREAWREHLAAPPPPVKAAPPPPPVKAAPPPPPVKAAPPPPPPVREVVPDDLTAIRGIGASMQARLNEFGLTTYARLAEASPAELRDRLGDFGRLARVDEWIAQASDLI